MTYKRNKAELITAKEASKEYPIIKDKLDDWFRANTGSWL